MSSEMGSETRQAESLLPPLHHDDDVVAADPPGVLKDGSRSAASEGVGHWQTEMQSPHGQNDSRRQEYVGLAIDPKTRRLVAHTSENIGAPPPPKPQALLEEDRARAKAAGIPLWITIENSVAWHWFKQLDNDGSGELDKNEAQQLCTSLKLKVKDFDSVFEKLDAGGDGTVSFSEFVHWFNELKTAERRERRLIIRDLFEKMDRDRSGSLSKAEIRVLVKKAKNRLNLVDPPFDIEKDWALMKKTGPAHDQEVNFPNFEDWWKGRSGIVDVSIPVLPEFMVLRIADVGLRTQRAERKQKHLEEVQMLPLKSLTRQDCARLTFDELVSRVDCDTLVERRARARGISGISEFDSATLGTGTGKTADDETSGGSGNASTLELRKEVLDDLQAAQALHQAEQAPDYDDKEHERSSRQVVTDMLMEQKGVPGKDFHRTGKELWEFLRPRLKFVVSLQSEWGNIHDLYPSHRDSVYEDVPLPPGIRDPDSTFSGMWDLMGLVLLLCVSVLIPLRTGFEIEVDPLSGPWFFDLFTDLYFIADLLINFRTAYHDPKGMREHRVDKIRANYLKGWFLVDFVSCLPVGYISLFVGLFKGIDDNTTEGSLSGTESVNTRAFKTLRLLRLGKMLRVAKALKFFEKYADQISMFMGIYVMIFTILFAAHLMACCWYAIGTGSQRIPLIDGDREGVLVTGWVYHQGWDMERVGLQTRYITALAGSFSALGEGGTDMEKLYGWYGEIMVGFIFGSIAGVMSQIMTSLKGNDQEFSIKMNGMKQWLKEQNISKPQQKRVLSYFREVWKTKTLFSEAEILSEMPPAMRNDLVLNLYSSVVREMPLFKGLSEEIIAGICLRAQPLMAIKDQEIMSEGLPGREMFMLLSGEVEVSVGQRTRRRLGFLSEGSFFGENPVLAGGAEDTEIRSRTVTAVTDCKLCFLVKDDIDALMAEYPAFQFRVKRFRQLGNTRNDRNLARLGTKSFRPEEWQKLQTLRNAKNLWAQAGTKVIRSIRGVKAFQSMVSHTHRDSRTTSNLRAASGQLPTNGDANTDTLLSTASLSDLLDLSNFSPRAKDGGGANGLQQPASAETDAVGPSPPPGKPSPRPSILASRRSDATVKQWDTEENVKQMLSTHSAEVKQMLATHTADMKRMLEEIVQAQRKPAGS